jgi:hypothetical protein
MRKRATAAAGAICAAAAASATNAYADDSGDGRDEDKTQLSWDKPVLCLFDGKGQAIFAQCNDDDSVCWFHRGCLGDQTGPSCERLEEIQPCVSPPPGRDYNALVAKGTKFVPAIAETPPGWSRDEHGRLFQTEFDMHRRVWIGGGWEPSYTEDRGERLGRATIEVGLRADVLSDDTRTRYRFEALTGEVSINPLSVRATAFRFDTSGESEKPLFRFTTFWPEPERHDLFPHLGGWLEVMRLEYRPRAMAGELQLRFISAGPTLDLWHSRDMSSLVRLRTGAAFEDLNNHIEDRHFLALTPIGALETDLGLDDAGLHHLVIGTTYDLALVWQNGSEASPTVTHRFMNELAFETILFAINDQPISLRVGGEGGYRDDIPPPFAGWEIRGGVGLRVNFWAPPPSAEDRRRIEAERGSGH